MATIKEIAALAGVSRGTVDRVLNNRGSVNPDTAEKIRDIARALDYKPNIAGLVLAAQKKKLKLGVVLFSAENPFFIDVEEGVTEKAEELAGYNCAVVIRHITYGVEQQLQAIQELLEEEVSGIALAPYNDERIRKCINTLYDRGIPVVTFNTDIENSRRIAYVGSHYAKSGETAAGLMHLMTHDKVRVGIVTGSPDILCHTERVAGFVNSLKRYKSDMEIVDVVENHDDEFESYEKTTRLLTEHPELNALFCRRRRQRRLPQSLRAGPGRTGPGDRFRQGAHHQGAGEKRRYRRHHLPAAQGPGAKPLTLLFAYLTTGEMPEKEYNYVAVDIRIRENI